MKKLLGIITIGVAVVALGACGGGGSDDEEAVVDLSVIVLASEAAVSELGSTLDTDCAIKVYTQMSEADIAILLENIDKFADPEADVESIGLSDEGLVLFEEINGCIS